MNYFYQDASGTQQGPASAEALSELAQSHRVHAGTLVWCEGMANWQAMSTVAELAGIRATSAPPAMPPPPSAAPASGADSAVSSIIPYKNVPALVGYYLAVFGLIPTLICFMIGGGLFGIVPVVLGVLGLRKVRQNPSAKGRAHCWVAIVLGGLEVIAAIVVIGLMIASA